MKKDDVERDVRWWGLSGSCGSLGECPGNLRKRGPFLGQLCPGSSKPAAGGCAARRPSFASGSANLKAVVAHACCERTRCRISCRHQEVGRAGVWARSSSQTSPVRIECRVARRDRGTSVRLRATLRCDAVPAPIAEKGRQAVRAGRFPVLRVERVAAAGGAVSVLGARGCADEASQVAVRDAG